MIMKDANVECPHINVPFVMQFKNYDEIPEKYNNKSNKRFYAVRRASDGVYEIYDMDCFVTHTFVYEEIESSFFGYTWSYIR